MMIDDSFSWLTKTNSVADKDILLTMAKIMF